MKKYQEERRAKALELKEERATRTAAQQIQRLDKMLGEGQGAKKERARLGQVAGQAEVEG